jgi:hypothetical protein
MLLISFTILIMPTISAYYLLLCFNKTIFNWSFCQSLLRPKKKPIAQKSAFKASVSQLQVTLVSHSSTSLRSLKSFSKASLRYGFISSDENSKSSMTTFKAFDAERRTTLGRRYKTFYGSNCDTIGITSVKIMCRYQ